MSKDEEILCSTADYYLGWNAAIDEIIKEIKQWDRGCSPENDIVPELEKLKK